MTKPKLKKNRQQGFTLVEIMVVIMIIAVMIGLTSITVGGQPERELKVEAQRLFQKIRLLADEAEFSGQEMGVSLQDDIIVFFVFDELALNWLPLTQTEYAPMRLAEEYQLELSLEGEAIDTRLLYVRRAESSNRDSEENLKTIDEPDIDEPEIFFFSDGQLSSFELRLKHKHIAKTAYLIKGVNPGRLSIERE